MTKVRLLFSVLLLVATSVAFAQDLKITHSPRESARAGERVRLRIKVDNPDNVDLVRLYFKSDLNSKYNFVNTKQLGKYIFAGQLPAATKDAKHIEYVFLLRNKDKKIIKTQKFKYKIKGEIPLVAHKKIIKVYSELDKAPKSIEGFDDNIEMDVAESGGKLAAVAGLYESQTASVAAASPSPTTSAAGAGGGISTTTIAATGAGGALIIGVIASGGGDSNGSGGENPPTQTITVIEFQPAQYSGTYAWDCQDDVNYGSTGITLDLQESNGVVTGTADYLGSTVVLSNGSYDSSNGALTFDLSATANTASNSFSGTFNPDNPTEKISGTMAYGESQSGEGCRPNGIAPAGTVTAY